MWQQLNKNNQLSREKGVYSMPTKANNSKTKKKQEKDLENQVKTLEIKTETMKKMEKEKKEREKIVKEKVDIIREDLKNQLLAQNKFGKQFDDMVEDYIFLVKLKEELQYDIKSNGIRYFTTTGNGFTSSKPNESVPNLLKVNGQMLKILQDLELKAPEENSGGEGDDLL